MNYGDAKMQAAGVAGPRQSRPMDRIADAANRIDAVNARLMDALSRFQNSPPRDNAGTDQILSVSYIDQLSRLHGGIDMLDKLTAELAELG